MRATQTVHAEPEEFIDSPSFRVNFWQQASPQHGWALDAWVLTDVEDINEVHQWIDENAHGRRFELFVEMEPEPVLPFTTPRTSGLIRLLGRDPNTVAGIEVASFGPA